MNKNTFDINIVRKEFPILHQRVNDKSLVYLDNAATTQKPKVVIDSLVNYYENDNANVHRGAHTLADRATKQFEVARKSVRQLLNAKEDSEIIWTKGTTESINLVAHAFLPMIAKEGKKVVVSSLEHHANFVPWQQQCKRLGIKFEVIPVDKNGELPLEKLDEILDENVAMLALFHVSNSVGTKNPVKQIIDMAHSVGTKVLIDGAQSVSHFDVDVQDLDCDFYVFSGHKLFAPTGAGVLYGKRELLDIMDVYQLGGEMIDDVSVEQTTFNVLPFKYEAGTPNISSVIALKKAIDFFNSIDKKGRISHEQSLMNYMTEQAREFQGLTAIALESKRTGVLSFTLDGIHNHDIAMMLDQQGVAVRTGHHCAMPIMKQLGLTSGSIRASVAFYNTHDEIDILFDALHKAQRMLA